VSEVDSIQDGHQEGNTPLHNAIQGGDVSRARKLIDSGANVNAINSMWQTPLHLAAWQGDVNSVGLLLAQTARTSEKTKTGKTPLHMASWMGHTNAVRLLLTCNKSTLHARDKTGETALHWAAWRGKVRTIEELVNSGADIESLDQFGMTPLLLAAQGGKHRAIGKLLDRGADIYSYDEEEKTALHWAAEKGNLKATIELLGRGANTEALDSRGRTPLHLACHYGHLDVARELIRHGADLGSRDKMGLTPLHLGAISGNRDVVRLLLGEGADVHAKDNDGMTPLHLAAWNGSRPVVEDLLNSGADPEEKCKVGQNAPIHMAARGGNLGALEALLSRGAYPDITNKNGKTPLHVAAKEGHLPVVLALLQENVEVSPKDRDGNTPYDLAVQYEHHDIAELLREYGAHPDGRGRSPTRKPRGARDITPRQHALPGKSHSDEIYDDQHGKRVPFDPAYDMPRRSPSPSYRRYWGSPAGGYPATRSPRPTSPARGAPHVCPDCGSTTCPTCGCQTSLPRSRSPSPQRQHPGVPNGGGRGRSLSPFTRPARRSASPLARRSKSPPAVPGYRGPAHTAAPDIAARGRPSQHASWADGMANALNRGLPQYSLEDLKKATDDFAGNNVLGESEDGVTYYGLLDGDSMAVRVLNPYKPEIARRFNRQIMAMATAPHPNLSPVKGICPQEFCIVYDYAPGGDLEKLLLESGPPAKGLTWKDRFKIAYDVVGAVHHLHSCCPEPVVHSNIRTSSVLLDSSLNARLAGASKALLESEANRLHEGEGVHAPSVQRDLVSLGMVMLQIITGDSDRTIEEMLVDMREALQEDRLLKIVDLDAGNWPHKALTTYVEVALSLVSASAFGPDLGSYVLPKLRRIAEVYVTPLPTVDALTGSPYRVDINPKPTPGAVLSDHGYV